MFKTAALSIAASLALAAPAAASQLIYSYDSTTPITEKMTENGVTFVLDKSLLRVKVLRILETQDVGAADLKPASESDLGHGGLSAVIGRDAHERDLYLITSQEDGKALSRALCRGSDRAWLAFGPIKQGRDLTVRAIGHDPATGKTRLCVTLDYAFHGEWDLPPAMLPQPDRTDRFNDAPNNRPF
jgi:hypothetical protein